MNVPTIRSRIPLLIMCLCAGMAASAAPPERRELGERVGDIAHPRIPMQSMNCTQSFENKGTYVMQANYSGGTASSDFIPANQYLEIRRVRATLRGPGLSGGNLSLSASGSQDWYDMRLENGAVVYSAATDGALYADRGSRIKFVAYRDSGYAQALIGDYVMSGCLVDKLPPIVVRPDLRAPHLPKKRPAPMEPVELPGVRPQQKTNPAG